MTNLLSVVDMHSALQNPGRKALFDGEIVILTKKEMVILET